MESNNNDKNDIPSLDYLVNELLANKDNQQ